MSTTTSAATQRILVWDVPVRVFHWLMVLSFAGAYLTAESERWRLVHVTLGYTLGGLIAFRLAWGVLGTRHARFASFVRGPAAVLGYLRSLLGARPEHHVGHNPAGALAIVLMLLLGTALVGSGYTVYNDLGPEWVEEVHELLGNSLLGVVLVHVAGVVVSGVLHRENLVRSMLTGFKQGPAALGIRRAWASVGALVLAAVLGFWWTQWQAAQTLAAEQARAEASQGAAGAQSRRKDDHDD